MIPIKYSVDDLLYLMARLRNADTGCPWDIKQSFETIAPCTLEEVYEVIDTIERGDYQHLNEELGDLLFQVVFYAQIGKEQQRFDFLTIVDKLVSKLLVRHPHVFPDGSLGSERDPNKAPDEITISQSWEALKNSSRNDLGKLSVLDDVPIIFPSLLRAQKIQKRAAGVGFDWHNVSDVIAKLEEEIDELKRAIAVDDEDNIEEELGDLLFSCVNLSRHLSVESEGALRRATSKFESRFRWLERSVLEQGNKIEALSLSELDALWNQAKQTLEK